jgi:hypothetical protein
LVLLIQIKLSTGLAISKIVHLFTGFVSYSGSNPLINGGLSVILVLHFLTFLPRYDPVSDDEDGKEASQYDACPEQRGKEEIKHLGSP